jgi:hypothetical protein
MTSPLYKYIWGILRSWMVGGKGDWALAPPAFRCSAQAPHHKTVHRKRPSFLSNVEAVGTNFTHKQVIIEISDG